MRNPSTGMQGLLNGDLNALLCLFKTQDGKPFVATPMQLKIIKSIVFKEPRVLINCMTRYGKSYCVSIAIILLAILRPGEKIVIIAPTMNHTEILMRYVSLNLGQHSHSILRAAVSDKLMAGARGLSQEVSKRRITFKNGSEVFLLSADIHNRGRALIGWGADTVVVDECEQIDEEIVRSLIMRMLGDNPETASAILLSNPSAKGYMFARRESPNWRKIIVPWQVALEEGRITKAWVEERRSEMSPNEFTIYYESKWPDTYDDQLISALAVKQCTDDQRIMSYIHYCVLGEPYSPESGKWEQFDAPKKRILGIDVATTGADLAILMQVDQMQDDSFIVHDIKEFPRTEVAELANIIYDLHTIRNFDAINLDASGIGSGVYSMLNDVYELNNVVGILMGSSPNSRDARKRFADKKAEYYFHLREIFASGRITIPLHDRLRKNLVGFGMNIRQAGSKLEVIRPRDRQKKFNVNVEDSMPSPDFADALCNACAPVIQDADLAIAFGEW